MKTIEIALMRAFTQPLPQAQSWIGEGLSRDGAGFTVTVGSYGEAALTVVRTTPATAPDTDDRADLAGRRKMAQPSGHHGTRRRQNCQPAPQSIIQLRSEMARLWDEVNRLREETRRLVRERRHIVATARLKLIHPARKQHLLDWIIAQRLRRQR